MFSHLEKKKAKDEWRRVEASKAAFLADTLERFLLQILFFFYLIQKTFER